MRKVSNPSEFHRASLNALKRDFVKLLSKTFWLAKSHRISYDSFDEHRIFIHNSYSPFAWAVRLVSCSAHDRPFLRFKTWRCRASFELSATKLFIT